MPHVFQFHPNANIVIQSIELDFCPDALTILYFLLTYQHEQLSWISY